MGPRAASAVPEDLADLAAIQAPSLNMAARKPPQAQLVPPAREGPKATLEAQENLVKSVSSCPNPLEQPATNLYAYRFRGPGPLGRIFNKNHKVSYTLVEYDSLTRNPSLFFVQSE